MSLFCDLLLVYVVVWCFVLGYISLLLTCLLCVNWFRLLVVCVFAFGGWLVWRLGFAVFSLDRLLCYWFLFVV